MIISYEMLKPRTPPLLTTVVGAPRGTRTTAVWLGYPTESSVGVT